MRKRIAGLRYLHVSKEFILLQKGKIIKDGKLTYDKISKRRILSSIRNSRDYIKEEIYLDRRKSKLDNYLNNRYMKFIKY